MMRGRARIFGVGLAVMGTSCAVGVQDDAVEPVGRVSSGQIIGTNDFVVVTNDGANIPAKYQALIDAFGVMSVGCTATHVGNGVPHLKAEDNTLSAAGQVGFWTKADAQTLFDELMIKAKK